MPLYFLCRVYVKTLLTAWIALYIEPVEPGIELYIEPVEPGIALYI
jgi:hypothetical protein